MSDTQTVLTHEVPAGWDALVASDPSASPAHRSVVWEAFAAALPGFEWRLLLNHEHGALVGGVPVLLARRGPFAWLYALPWLLPAPPLAATGAHGRVDRALCAAFTTLAREQHVVGGAWSFYRPDGPEVEAAALALVPGDTRRYEAALLRLEGGAEAVRAAMGRKQRQALGQVLARDLRFAEEPAALEEAYALHLAQSRHWSGHRPLPLELSRRLLAARPVTGEAVARLFTLRSPRGIVSAALALDGVHETFLWWSGTHPQGRRRDAFTRLVWEVAEWAATRGRKRLNLGASPGLAHVASFKRSLGAEVFDYPTRWLDARDAPWPGRALAALQHWRRRSAQGTVA